MSARIEDYALIGDLETAALVSRGGCIDWLCWPRFDSDACFAGLLGNEEHGGWSIAPQHEHKSTRRYRKDTLILETRFETGDGAVTLIDFMPPRGEGSHIVRIVKGERGSVTMCTRLAVRFGYGATVPWVTRLDEQTIRGVAGPDMVLLRAPFRLRGENLKTVGEFTVKAGDTVAFALTYAPSHLPPPEPLDCAQALAVTEKFWIEWSAKSRLRGPWDEAVMRSLITLKALTYIQTGALVAAPTTSLPEKIGGERNWDYRFCWLRDATLTLLSMMNAGYYGEAAMWRDWLLRAVAGSPAQMQIMYGIGGERRLTEWQVPWLPGYENSKPVRIGNAAHNQLQIDVYGEVMDALHQARVGGIEHSKFAWELQKEILKHLTRIWAQPDAGIWEVRGELKHFTYSKAMAWLAFDRAIQSAEKFKLDGPLDEWRELRERIHADVCAHGFDEKRNTFVRCYGSRHLDASLLLLPVIGFLHPQDKRILGTIAAVERDLMSDGLVRRYDTEKSDDGLPPGEGQFLACSFWLVDALVMIGRKDDARALFERLLKLRNDVGLLAEEYDPLAKRQVGNFPQAFSHLALVNSASNLAQAEKPVEQRSRHPAPGNTGERTPAL